MDKIDPSELWQYRENRLLIDVRSPAEYAHAHIPHAKSLPLFNDAERAKVGTAYKQVSPENALIRGLEFVGPKMSGFVKKMIKWAPDRKVIVHCWRGGKRSGSMAWLLRFAGFDVLTLTGGYKNYRNFILQEFESQRLKPIILGGKTGSGKTYILKELEKQGEQIIDLEALAHHKGSAFGWIGEQTQPSTEQFENDLYEVFKNIDLNRRVWIENESHSVGTVFIPQPFWQQMKNAPLIHVEVPFEARVQHLIEGYTTTAKADLIQSFQKIAKKLGPDALKKSIEAVENADYATAAAIALKYYDKTYTHGFDTTVVATKHTLNADACDHTDTAKRLIKFADAERY